MKRSPGILDARQPTPHVSGYPVPVEHVELVRTCKGPMGVGCGQRCRLRGVRYRIAGRLRELASGRCPVCSADVGVVRTVTE